VSGGQASSRRRIAVVVPKYGLVGGGERFAAEIAERLARDDRYEVHVLANRWRAGSDRISFHRVPMIRFPRFLRPWSFAWFADRMIARGRFDLVHAHERVLRADVVSVHFVPHASWVREVRRKRPSLFDRAVIALERRMMRGARKTWFLPVSSLAAEALRREYGIDPARVRVVHPGVDFERFSSPDRGACRAQIRTRHGIGPDDLLVLFVGMNFEVKGLGTLIAAVARARRMRPEAGIRLLVVGRGDERRYRSLAREHGIADAVSFAGPVAEGIERYYRAADVFAMLSTFDTFGMVVLEAMAAGLPVIVSENVGAKDLVEDGKSGFVVEDRKDAGGIAERLAAMADAARRRDMAEQGARIAGGYRWEEAAGRLAVVYDSVLDRTVARAGERPDGA